jgi:hypothetical protein
MSVRVERLSRLDSSESATAFSWLDMKDRIDMPSRVGVMNHPKKRDLALLAVQHTRADTRSETVKTKHVSSATQISLWSPPVKFSLVGEA